MSKFKQIMFFALTLASALVLVACTGETPPPAEEVVEEPETVEEAEPVEEDQPAEETTEETVEEEVSSVTVTDGLGEEFTFEGTAERIVSVTLGTDEILLTLVGTERLVGVTYLATDPSISNAADLAADVENIVEADPEQIIALEPDLVFVETFTDPAVIEQIESAGIPVFIAGSLDSIDGVRGNILVLGQLTGDEARAQEMVEEMDTALKDITQPLEGASVEPLSVLYLAPDGWVAGSSTTLHDIIEHAGGLNAAAEAGLDSWQQVSEETIIEIDPDVILVSSFMPVDDVLTNPVYASLSAVQNARVYQANDVHLSAVSQYIVLGVQDVATILYPDLFGGE
jgi:iron complex transport system substrate-binding protein